MTVKPKKLINTFNKIGRGVILPESLNGIMSKYPVESGDFYTKWSDGTMEQTGTFYGTSNGSSGLVVEFPIPFSVTHQVTVQAMWASIWNWHANTYEKTKTGFKFTPVLSTNGTQVVGSVAIDWIAKGRWY